jgi:hypothetical protein
MDIVDGNMMDSALFSGNRFKYLDAPVFNPGAQISGSDDLLDFQKSSLVLLFLLHQDDEMDSMNMVFLRFLRLQVIAFERECLEGRLQVVKGEP